MVSSRCSRRSSVLAFIACAFIAQLFFARPVSAQSDAVPGQFIIKFNRSSSGTAYSAQRSYMRRSLGVRTLKSNPITGSELVESESNQTIDHDYAKQLLADGLVDYIEPNYIVQAYRTPNDSRYEELWGMHNSGQTGGLADVDIDAPEAWDQTLGSSAIVVGVVDTGVDYSHPDLINNMWVNNAEIPNNGIDDDGNGVVDDVYGYNAIDGGGNPIDENGHGTHCSGTIGAVGNNGTGVVGGNWNVKIMGLKFLDAGGFGSTQGAISAIEYAINMKNRGVNIRVLSNSWGGGAYSQALEDAIRSAENVGILFVAAAGNDGKNNDTSPSYPANYNLDSIVSVAALDHNGNLADFSNYGPATVDIGAPGVDILSTTLSNGYRLLSGTSMATPHVSAVAALVLSKEPNMPYQSLKQRLLGTVKLLPQLNSQMRSPGIVSAIRALTNETSPVPPPPAEVNYTKTFSNFAYDNSLGTLLTNGDDEYRVVSLPFAFPYYGQSANRLAISTNGRIVPLLQGQQAPNTADYSNQLNPGILAYHDDLVPSQFAPEGGGVWFKTTGNSAVITWLSVNYANRSSSDSASELRFQAELFLNGDIRLHYLDTHTGRVELDHGASATVGIVPIAGASGNRISVSHNTTNFEEVGPGKSIGFGVETSNVFSDFDGDGRSDIVVFRPPTGMWYILYSAKNFDFAQHKAYQLGLPGDVPLVGEFDGDGIADMAVWRPSDGNWFFRLSSNGYTNYTSVQWGLPGDEPLSGDYDGDGLTDLTVFRKSAGRFFSLRSQSGYNRGAALLGDQSSYLDVSLGAVGHNAFVGRFTNTNRDEFLTIWQLIRFWSVKNSSNQLLFSQPWGEPGDTPVPMDADGDGLTDRIISRQIGSNWQWYTAFASGGARVDTFGASDARPVGRRDFDGDGKDDMATFHNATGMWNIKHSSSGSEQQIQFGLPGDLIPK